MGSRKTEENGNENAQDDCSKKNKKIQSSNHAVSLQS